MDNIDTVALRAAIERRHSEWVHEYSLFGKATRNAAAARVRARILELEWVLRLIDGGNAVTGNAERAAAYGPLPTPFRATYNERLGCWMVDVRENGKPIPRLLTMFVPAVIDGSKA